MSALQAELRNFRQNFISDLVIFLKHRVNRPSTGKFLDITEWKKPVNVRKSPPKRQQYAGYQQRQSLRGEIFPSLDILADSCSRSLREHERIIKKKSLACDVDFNLDDRPSGVIHYDVPALKLVLNLMANSNTEIVRSFDVEYEDFINKRSPAPTYRRNGEEIENRRVS